MSALTISPKSILVYAVSNLKQHCIKETATIQIPLLAPEMIDQAAKKLDASLSLKTKMGFNGRFERGVLLAKQGAVKKVSDPKRPDMLHLFRVRSSNPYIPPGSYLVDLEHGTCECPDFWKGHYCKHRIAARIIEIATQDADKLKPIPKVSDPTPIASSETNQSAVASDQLPQPISQDENDVCSETFRALQEARYDPQKEHVIWAIVRHNGSVHCVEVLYFDGNNASVRALPKIIDGKKLQPQFPFPGGSSTMTVSKTNLFYVKVFQKS